MTYISLQLGMHLLKLKDKLIKIGQQDRLHNIAIPVIGLTGGIASGKSTVSKILKQAGHPLIDADEEVKKIYQKAETIEFIQKNVPHAVINAQIHFPTLRTQFFNDPELRARVETFIYQRLPTSFNNTLKSLGQCHYVFYDVPLLFEKKLNSSVDLSILVYTSPENQLQRLIQRDAITEDLARKMLRGQLPIDSKRILSDYVIENTGTMLDLKDSVHRLCDEIFMGAK